MKSVFQHWRDTCVPELNENRNKKELRRGVGGWAGCKRSRERASRAAAGFVGHRFPVSLGHAHENFNQASQITASCLRSRTCTDLPIVNDSCVFFSTHPRQKTHKTVSHGVC